MDNLRKTVNIYTDGACSGNPGPGGWAAILEFGQHRKELSGYMAGTTNNRMELFAAISGLGALKEPCNVNLYSDSNYLVQAFNEHWIENWKKNGWKTSGGGKVENQDLWFILSAQTKKHHVSFFKVKGHADHPENNRCDELARAAIDEYRRINQDGIEDNESAESEKAVRIGNTNGTV
jgi:ribonuclease HI